MVNKKQTVKEDCKVYFVQSLRFKGFRLFQFQILAWFLKSSNTEAVNARGAATSFLLKRPY